MTNPASPILDYAPRRQRSAALRKFAWRMTRLAMTVLLIAGAGMATYFLQPTSYTAVGFLQFTGVGNEPDLDAQRAGEAATLNSATLLNGAIARATSPVSAWTVPQYQAKIEVRAIPDSKLIELRCTDRSSTTAADGVNQILAEAQATSQFQWSPAQLAAAPIAPHRNPIWALLGSIAVIVMLLALRAWKEGDARELP
jgi:hypothetical protein